MTKSELLVVLERLGVHPSRKLGQNFLVDANLLAAMVRDASPVAGEQILEIGPGTGVLTRCLLEAGVNLTAVEFDHRLAKFLSEEFAHKENFRLIQGDACRQNYEELMGINPYRCIANLPYACSSVIIGILLDCANPPTEWFILLQKEMADRLAARPGNKDYGSLSARVQFLYDVSIIRNIPREVFFPPPEIASSFVKMKLRSSVATAVERKHAAKLVQLGFAQRRKKLSSRLASEFPLEKVVKALEFLQIDANARAENLSPDQYLELSRILND